MVKIGRISVSREEPFYLFFLYSVQLKSARKQFCFRDSN